MNLIRISTLSATKKQCGIFYKFLRIAIDRPTLDAFTHWCNHVMMVKVTAHRPSNNKPILLLNNNIMRFNVNRLIHSNLIANSSKPT